MEINKTQIHFIKNIKTHFLAAKDRSRKYCRWEGLERKIRKIHRTVHGTGNRTGDRLQDDLLPPLDYSSHGGVLRAWEGLRPSQAGADGTKSTRGTRDEPAERRRCST